MAYIATDAKIRATNVGEEILGLYQINIHSATLVYHHFKTNATSTSNTMFRITAKGSHYNLAKPIHCTWVGYGSGGVMYNVGLQNVYTGMTANSVYIAADGAVCFCGYTGTNAYDTRYTLHSMTPCPTGGAYNLAITSFAVTTSGANYF